MHSFLEQIIVLSDMHLKELYLGNTPLKCVQGIHELTALKKLFLHSTKISSVEGIGKLVNLEKLDLSERKLSWITGLEQLQELQELNLWNTPMVPPKKLRRNRVIEEA